MPRLFHAFQPADDPDKAPVLMFEGAARPGVLRGAGTQFRFPTYEAGHAVTVTAAAELGEDVKVWLEVEGALRAASGQ